MQKHEQSVQDLDGCPSSAYTMPRDNRGDDQMCNVKVKPSLFNWARSRSGRDNASINKNFPALESWERGETLPSLKELGEFAKATYTPIGYFFLDKPPDTGLPISDFRTVGGTGVDVPSAALLDTIYLCQRRQEWYGEEVRATGGEPLGLVGSMNTTDDVVSSAKIMRAAIKFNVEQRRSMTDKDAARRQLVSGMEDLGILVMMSGVVGNNTWRKLDVTEFRGFALADPWAPLVFVNSRDAEGAKIFTLVHEAAHIWLGRSAVSNNSVADAPDHVVEGWCNAVAAELLVPSEVIRETYDGTADLDKEVDRLVRRFKVSRQVILRRIYDTGGLDRTTFQNAYDKEVALAAEREKERKKRNKEAGKKDGNYYNNVLARAGKKFTTALLASTMEGRTSPIMSRRLLDVWKTSNIETLLNQLGVGR